MVPGTTNWGAETSRRAHGENDDRHDPDRRAPEIKALLRTYERSLNTGDAALAASLYAEGGVFMPLLQPTATGAEIEGSYRQIFDTIQLDVTFTTDELTVAGDLAYARTRSEGHVTVLEHGVTAPRVKPRAVRLRAPGRHVEDRQLHVQQDRIAAGLMLVGTD